MSSIQTVTPLIAPLSSTTGRVSRKVVETLAEKASTVLGHTQFVKWGHDLTAVALPIGAAAIATKDTLSVKNAQQRKKRALENVLVYGLGTLGTLLAARQLMVKGLMTELKENPLTGKELQKLVQYAWRMLKSSKTETEKLTQFEKFWEKQFASKFRASEASESLGEQLGEIAQLFVVGAAGIGAAAFGGALAAGQENNEALKSQKRHYIARETTYQLITNIVMCALGASSGTVLADRMEQALSKGTQNLAHALPMKAARFGLVVSGVMLSLVAGAPVSNFVYQKLIAPLFFKESNASLKEKKDSNPLVLPGKRTVESMDWAIHYDDLLAAAKLTLTKALEAGVLPFFLFSAVRAGSGYTQGETLEPTPRKTEQNKPFNPAFNAEASKSAVATPFAPASAPAFASLKPQNSEGPFSFQSDQQLPLLTLAKF